MLRIAARALGLRLTMWDVDPDDWRRPGAGDRSQTVAALQQVLAPPTARGFRFRAPCR